MVPARTIGAMLEALAVMGMDVAVLRRRLRIPAELEPTQMLPDGVLTGVSEAAALAFGRQTIALEVGQNMPFGAFGALDYYARATNSVGSALCAVQGALQHVALGVALEIGREGDVHTVAVVDREPFEGAHWSDELMLATLWFRVRGAARDPIALQEVALIRPEPDDPEAFADLLGCPVSFARARSSLRVAAAVWSTPMAGRDPRLAELLGPQLRPGPHPLVLGVRAVVRRDLERREPAVGEIAHELGMSSRTLQRRLTDEGTSFRSVVSEVRREAAEAFLRDPAIPLARVAQRLGFNDQAAFTRAFRRWTGTTPSRWRRALP